mgnify:CR=1 FL=1
MVLPLSWNPSSGREFSEKIHCHIYLKKTILRWKDETRSEGRWIAQVMIDTYVGNTRKGNRIFNLHLEPVDEQASMYCPSILLT